MENRSLISKLFAFLNADLTGNTWQSESSHHYFGEMVYYGFKKNNNGYWECEVACEGGTVFVGIDSPTETPPTSAHVEFVQSIIKDVDVAFALTQSKIVEMFEDFCETPFPKEWRKVFVLTGIFIPLNADRINNWELSFECLVDKDGHTFTCYFENNIPVGVSVDG